MTPPMNYGDDGAHLSGSERELAAIMARSILPVSPPTARALQATENAWREIGRLTDLLSSSQVALFLGKKADDRAYVSRLRRRGQLLAVRRLNAYRYPNFQFDGRSGHVKRVIVDLVDVAKRLGWSQEELILWLCAPSGYFADRMPVDYLDEPAVLLARAATDFQTEW